MNEALLTLDQIAFVPARKYYRIGLLFRRKTLFCVRFSFGIDSLLAEASFPRARQFSEYNGKEASASRELYRRLLGRSAFKIGN